MDDHRGLFVSGAVVQGTDHLAAGIGCQDALKSARCEDGEAVVLAVADGAGSRDRSALGAHLAVDTACRVLARDLPGGNTSGAGWTEWIGGRAKEVVDAWLRATRALPAAAEYGEGAVGTDGPLDGGAHRPGPGEFATTLAAAVVKPPWAAFLCVGNCFGTVLTMDSDSTRERCHLVLPPPDERHSPLFLSSPGARTRVRSFALWDPDLTGVMLATDGCVPLTLDHPDVHGLPPAAGPLPSTRFFVGLAAALRDNGGDAEPLRALLCSPEAGRSGDDLTVLCALTGRGTRTVRGRP
ncbi:protein phosphatase 2C domain-containing protein [Streptomyces sp. 21So2-11]|uniref:protein phosphatase 2C domain-containing protein n=1 Tax=Streptomyces sp. 21So2-11 TaxID=3144408 RepID=UPI00321B7581